MRKEFNLSEKTATFFEAATFILVGISWYWGVNKTGYAGEWFRINMLYTPTSVFIIFLFALNRGMVSKALTCKLMVYIGNISGYAFLIHQLIIRYLLYFSGEKLKYPMLAYTRRRLIVMVIAFPVSILCTKGYMYLENRIKAFGERKLQKN